MYRCDCDEHRFTECDLSGLIFYFLITPYRSTLHILFLVIRTHRQRSGLVWWISFPADGAGGSSGTILWNIHRPPCQYYYIPYIYRPSIRIIFPRSLRDSGAFSMCEMMFDMREFSCMNDSLCQFVYLSHRCVLSEWEYFGSFKFRTICSPVLRSGLILFYMSTQLVDQRKKRERELIMKWKESEKINHGVIFSSKYSIWSSRHNTNNGNTHPVLLRTNCEVCKWWWWWSVSKYICIIFEADSIRNDCWWIITDGHGILNLCTPRRI